ncbi:Leo1-like protein-domain-containing protein [Russula dissimulans]|nr:Leo1-like protein-domain-containing protein [Russula dissimulans]
MSSLAGALVPPDITYDRDNVTSADVDMHSSSFDDAPPEHYPKQEEELGDLFGEDSNVDFVHHSRDQHQASGAPSTAESRYSSPASAPPQDDGLSSPDRKRRQALEYEEEDEPNPLIEHRLEASVSIPNIPLPKSSDGQHWVIRMPNFVKVDSKPFHPDTYVGPEHEEDFLGGTHERDMGIKLRVENTVRWRWTKDKDDRDNRQSNAHIIRWSDGSMSLRLGKEYFDINQVIDSSGSAHRQAFGLSQNSQSHSQGTPTPTPTKAHGLTYLVAQHKRAEILQAEAAITGFLTLRPTDMQSETHRLVVRAVGQKHSKVARLRMAPDMDPEREKQELIRASAKKPRHARAGEEGGSGAGGARRRRASGGGRRRSAGDMDIWSDDDDAAYDAYGNDGDDGRSPAKKRRAREPEERRGGEYQTDDFVVADSDSDDAAAAGHGSDVDGGAGDGRATRARKKRAGREDAEEEEEEDVLDKLDAQISQQEANRKRRRDEAPDAPEGGGGDQAGEEAMDIESEEDEEFRVRRAGGVRKRTTVAGFDEEDE